MQPVNIHPACMSIQELNKHVRFSFRRDRGPGGQHRNKVETWVEKKQTSTLFTHFADLLSKNRPIPIVLNTNLTRVTPVIYSHIVSCKSLMPSERENKAIDSSYPWLSPVGEYAAVVNESSEIERALFRS